MTRAVYVNDKRFDSCTKAAHWLGVDKSCITRAAQWGIMVRGHWVKYADGKGVIREGGWKMDAC